MSLKPNPMNRNNSLLLIILFFCFSNLADAQTIFVNADNGEQIELNKGKVLIITENDMPQAYGIKFIGKDDMALGNRHNAYMYPYSTLASFDVSRFSERQIKARRIAGWILVGIAGTFMVSTSIAGLVLRSRDNGNCNSTVVECDDSNLPFGIIMLPVFVSSTSIGIAGTIPLLRARSASRKGTRVTNAPFYFH